MIKRDLHQFDDEFNVALHRAVELGPWEPELLTEIADVGLSAWEFDATRGTGLDPASVRAGTVYDRTFCCGSDDAHRNTCAERQDRVPMTKTSVIEQRLFMGLVALAGLAAFAVRQ